MPAVPPDACDGKGGDAKLQLVERIACILTVASMLHFVLAGVFCSTHRQFVWGFSIAEAIGIVSAFRLFRWGRPGIRLVGVAGLVWHGVLIMVMLAQAARVILA